MVYSRVQKPSGGSLTPKTSVQSSRPRTQSEQPAPIQLSAPIGTGGKRKTATQMRQDNVFLKLIQTMEASDDTGEQPKVDDSKAFQPASIDNASEEQAQQPQSIAPAVQQQESLEEQQPVQKEAVESDATSTEVQMKCSQCEATEAVQQSTADTGNAVGEPAQSPEKGILPAKSIHEIAAKGFNGSATALPHLNKIQQSFGTDLSGVQAYIGGDAAVACKQIGAAAYAKGNQIAFKEQPSLELAAHEAAHTVQQASGKVQLAGGVGQVGDKYEQNADAVAAKVGAGESAAHLLADFSGEQKTDRNQQRLPQGQSSTDQRTPQKDGDLYALVDGGVISIPLAIGTIMVIVGATGIIINWKDITGTLTQLGQIAIDWVNDTAGDVTSRMIDLVSQAGVAARNDLERFRGAIEAIVSHVFQSRKKRSNDEEAQNEDEVNQEEESERPSRKECQKAIKILTQYERLAAKFGKRIPPARLAELNRLRDTGSIRINDIPGTLHSEFPKGTFGDKTLDEIRDLCGM